MEYLPEGADVIGSLKVTSDLVNGPRKRALVGDAVSGVTTYKCKD